MPPISTSTPPSVWVCPTCRAETHAPDRPGLPVPRCEACDKAMVVADALAASDGDPFLGRVIAERFVVLRRLGSGSMGTVYRARQEAVARDVAVKILRSDRAIDELARQRFVREAKAMSLLASPHTVTVFDFGEMAEPQTEDDLGSGSVSLFLAMELLDGESLGARIKRAGRMTYQEAANVTRQALLSLGEAHDKGVIHRDLKPDNLFLALAPNGGEVVKVLDFGIAKVLTDKSPMVDALETQAGTVFGTPRYMSPEQAQGRSLDARSDLYSLGVLLYQMLVGRPPFTDDDAVVVMARHIKQKPTPPHEAAKDAQIPLSISQLVMRALAKNPEERPSSATAFAEALEEAMRTATATPETRSIPPPDATASGSVRELSGIDQDFDQSEPNGPAGTSEKAPATPRGNRTLPIAALLVGAVSVAAVTTVIAGKKDPVPVARSVVGPATKLRADVLLATLTARAADSAEPKTEASAASSSTSSAGAAPAPPTSRPKLGRPKYKRFD